MRTSPAVAPLAPWLPALVLLPFALITVYTMLRRFATPFELEWNEGHTLEAIYRVLNGLPLYPPAEDGWVPYIYPPLYYYLSALLTTLQGNLGFYAPRSLSVVATIATCLGLHLATLRLTRQQNLAVLSWLLYLGWFRASGFWYDLARVDSLANAFFIWGVVFAVRPVTTGRATITAIFFLLAIASKTTFLPAVLLLFLLMLRRQFDACFPAFLLFLFTVLNGAMVYTRLGNDWFLHYVVGNALAHPRDFSSLTGFPPPILTAFILPLLVPLLLAGIWFLKAPRGGFLPRGWPVAVLFIALSGLSLSSYFLFGGFVNNFMPAFLAASLLVPVMIPGVLRLLPLGRRPIAYAALGLLFLILNLVPGGARFSPRQQIPSAEALAARAGLMDFLEAEARAGNRVLVIHHQHYGIKTGHPPTYNVDMIRVANWAGDPVPLRFLNELISGEIDAIILNHHPLSEAWLPPIVRLMIQEHYFYAGPLPALRDPAKHEALIPLTGAPTAPRHLWRWRRELRPENR